MKRKSKRQPKEMTSQIPSFGSDGKPKSGSNLRKGSLVVAFLFLSLFFTVIRTTFFVNLPIASLSVNSGYIAFHLSTKFLNDDQTIKTVPQNSDEHNTAIILKNGEYSSTFELHVPAKIKSGLSSKGLNELTRKSDSIPIIPGDQCDILKNIYFVEHNDNPTSRDLANIVFNSKRINNGTKPKVYTEEGKEIPRLFILTCYNLTIMFIASLFLFVSFTLVLHFNKANSVFQNFYERLISL